MTERTPEALIAAGEAAGDGAADVMRALAPDARTLARAMWAGFAAGRLRPVSSVYWRAMAADPSVYHLAVRKRIAAIRDRVGPALARRLR